MGRQGTARRIGTLGTGVVGRTLAAMLSGLGHDVVVGSRTEIDDARTFAEASAHGEAVLNGTAGLASLAAVGAAGADNLAGKPLVDISHARDFSGGSPPEVAATDFESLSGLIKAAFPAAREVKALNT